MFRIVTDTSSNLPTAYLQAENITVIPFTFHTESGEVFTNNYCGDRAQSIFNLLAAFAEETEAGIFSRPAPDGGWKCPECGMPNGSSVFCAECGARRPAE